MADSIFLERIQVNKLFDKFTYDIDLKNGQNVAILIAPNGCGKTTIFNMVDFIFRPTIAKLRKILHIPFENCICTLSNGKTVGLEIRNTEKSKKNEDISSNQSYEAIFKLELESSEVEGKVFLTISDGEEEHSLDISSTIQEAIKIINDSEIPFFSSSILPEPLEHLMENLDFFDFYEDDIIRDMPRRYKTFFIQLSKGFKKIIEFREKYCCKFDINFISADRLYRQNLSFKKDFYRFDEHENNPLFFIQERVKELYRKIDSEYKKLVSEARDKLPKMFLNSENKTEMSFDEFEKSWKEYVSDMEKYYQLGLIESTQTILENDRLEKSFDENGCFLSVYLGAFKITLDPWKKQYERMKLFVDIFNTRNEITGKILKYGPNGLIIKVGERVLPLECLSSGEKNDLIMFYNLIFNSEKGALVLIDEPEISLHIQWQEEYIDFLLNICKMNELHAIVATHSPNIVNGHWELYANRGLEDES